jgi:chemotaxis protein MotB
MGRKKKDDDEGGGDDWLTTFADMATLLMSFFVLILSFAELDVIKYKAVVGSMKQALGVDAKEMEFLKSPTEKKDATKRDTPATTSGDKSIDAMLMQQITTQARLIREQLSEFVQESLVAVEEKTDELIIRIPERGVFTSGSAILDPSYRPVLHRIRDALRQADGEILVSGHTDDRPINNPLYRNNWDLSVRRAASVVSVILEEDLLSPARVSAHGFADQRPLVPNSDDRSRQLNRRVEISVQRKKPDVERIEPTLEEVAAEDFTDDELIDVPEDNVLPEESDPEGVEDDPSSAPEPEPEPEPGTPEADPAPEDSTASEPPAAEPLPE